MFARHDTTGSSISFTLFCLSTNPDAQKKAVEEQKNIFGDDRHRPATHRNLQEIKYLEMVIKESMRMYPPVPYIARQTKRDVEYKDGHIIPEGTGIFVLNILQNPINLIPVDLKTVRIIPNTLTFLLAPDPEIVLVKNMECWK